MASMSSPTTKKAKMDHPLSPSLSQRNYDVFLSFRGVDTRDTVISHLFRALTQKGMFTFKDNEELELGDNREELFGAIEGSRVAVVMFSENYARSEWCLEELVKIMELYKLRKLKVLPIFYRISPREVRLQGKGNGERGCYETAMKDMEANFGTQRANIWRDALLRGGNLIGSHIQLGVDEGYVVEQVVKKALELVSRLALEADEHRVGINRHFEAVKPLLHIDRYIDRDVDDVYMVGIHGPGGVGKTTLSKEIVNRYANQFDGWCFLSDVREESGISNGVVHLQQRLLRKLLRQEDLVVSSSDHGKAMIRERLCDQKVLVILDDINNLDQFDSLAGNFTWFGRGSRIIITTRDRHVLTSDRVKYIYKVSLLRKDEADDLFRWHAFRGKREGIDIDNDLIDRFLAYADGLPLALVVLGGFLRDRRRYEWESTLLKLENGPNKAINSVLKVSFDGLDDQEKEIFLDIACFFKGLNKDFVKKVLDSCGFAASIGLNILAERCLIAIDMHGTISMHDLLVAMGESIIHDKKTNGIPSRIWLYEDFRKFLSEYVESNAVTGIALHAEEMDEQVNPDTFLNLKRLRLLIAPYGLNPVAPLHLPSGLRWVEWWGYSASTIEFCSWNELVGLNLEDSSVTRIHGKDFAKLKYLNLACCESLHMLPNLSKSVMLEELILRDCKNLSSIPEVVGSLENLTNLDLEGCSNLTEVPTLLKSKNFRSLCFSGCSRLKKFAAIDKKLEFLCELRLDRTGVRELPNSIGNLAALEILNLEACLELMVIPSSIYKLQALVQLHMNRCRKLEHFPRKAEGEVGFPRLERLELGTCSLKDLHFLNDLTCHMTLKCLILSGNNFSSVPTCISEFTKLERFPLHDCQNLVEIRTLPQLMGIDMSRCLRLETLPCLYTFLFQTPIWSYVDLSDCHLLDPSYIDRSLLLEKLREFHGAADVIVPGEKIPQWMKYQTGDCESCYGVSVPEGMSKGVILGLALFVTFEVDPNDCYCPEVRCMVGSKGIERMLFRVRSTYTWFVFRPCRPLYEIHSKDFAADIRDWSHISFRPGSRNVKLTKCGVSVICKQEQDEQRIMIYRIKTGRATAVDQTGK